MLAFSLIASFSVLTFSLSILQLLRQQRELIRAEGVELEFEDDAIREIARMAAQLNKSVENTGARRLHTVLERIMETISFEAAEMEKGTKVVFLPVEGIVIWNLGLSILGSGIYISINIIVIIRVS